MRPPTRVILALCCLLAALFGTPLPSQAHVARPQDAMLRLTDLPHHPRYVVRLGKTPFGYDGGIDYTARFQSIPTTLDAPGGETILIDFIVFRSVTDAEAQVNAERDDAGGYMPWSPTRIGDDSWGRKDNPFAPTMELYLVFRRGAVFVRLDVAGAPGSLQPGIVAGYARAMDGRLMRVHQ